MGSRQIEPRPGSSCDGAGAVAGTPSCSDGGTRLAPVAASQHAAETHYRSLVESMPVGLCRATRDGRFLHANPAFLRITGYPSLEALQRIGAPDLYVNPADRDRWTTQLREDGQFTDFEAQVRRGDGAIIWVWVSLRAVLDPVMQALCYESVVVDITPRKRAEAETRNRALQLEMFADVSRRLRQADRLEQMYPILVDAAMGLLQAQHGALNLVDADRERLTTVYQAGAMPGATGQTFPIAGSFSGRVIATGTPYVIDDIAREERFPWLRPAYYDILGPVVIVPVQSEHGAIGTLSLGRVRNGGLRPFVDSEVRLVRALAEIGGTAIRRAQLHNNLEQAYLQMVLALARTVDARDSYTGSHSEHLAVWTEAVARELGCGEDERRAIRWGALLHDIGKIGVPDEVLRKPSPLTEDEWAIMRRHPSIGEEILRPVERMVSVAALVRHHQERWDGTGYPDGLRGEMIPLGARIIAVADAYSAMMDDRAYRKGRRKEEALQVLRRGAGTQFDPRVVEVFCRILEEGAVTATSPQAEEDTAARPAVQAIARSLTQVRQAGRLMPAMADVAKRLLRPLDLAMVLEEILSQIQDVFAYPMCAICLLDEHRHELRVVAQRGHDPAATAGLPGRVEEHGVLRWVARHGRPYYAANAMRDPLCAAEVAGAASQVAYPLIVDGRVIGVLHVASPVPDAFPPDVRDALETFATLAGLAILRARRDDELQRLALTDGLTGLANHRALWDTLEREVARARRDARPLSVVIVEIDQFKITNDRLGHLEGDTILRAVAQELTQHTRAGDLAARLGGDEFVLVLPGASKAEAVQIAERIRGRITDIPRGMEGKRLTVSVGVAGLPDDGGEARALVDAADHAMYQAKYIGGNRVNVA